MAEERINGTVLTIFSTASSVGKTLVSINMAAELARTEAMVCLVDLDLQFGDVRNYLQLESTRTIADVQQAINVQGENCPVEEFISVYAFEETVFHVIPSPLKLEEAYNMSDKVIQTAIRRLRSMYDFVIIDTASMFSTLNLMLLDLSTIVTFLGIMDFIPTIKNMKIGTDTLRSLNYDENKLRIVLNREGSNTRISMKDVEQLLGTPFDFILPNDFRAASKSIQTGVPLVLEDDGTELSAKLRDLVYSYTNRAAKHSSSVGNSSDNSGWFRRLFR